MFRYIIKRFVLLIPVIIIVSFIIFGLMELAPGTPIDGLITEGMTEADIQALREQFNLHRSMFYRYGLYMLNLVRGDLGVSEITGASVWSEFMLRLPNTLVLSLSALIVGAALAIPLGVAAARRAGKIQDNVITTFTLLGISMPAFWFGLMLMLIFSLRLGWFPAGGNLHGIRSLILPAVCSALTLMGASARQARSSMLEVLKADYLRTARAKGVPENVVVRKHALGNAWIPIVTTLGTGLSFQLAGAAVVETVFTWPGIGRLLVDSVMARDVTTATGTVIMTTILYVVLLLIVDVLYAFIDPRIKAQYIRSSMKKKKSLAGAQPVPVLAGAAGDADSVSVSATAVGLEQAQEEPGAQIQHAAVSSAGIEQASDKSETQSEPAASFVTRQIIEDREHKSDKKDGSVAKQYRKRSQIGEIFHSIRRNKGATAGFVLVCLLFLVFLGSLFIRFELVTATNLRYQFAPPSWQHPFGTDQLGRSMLLRTLYGTRYSIAVALGATTLSALIGITLGALAGYYGKLADEVIMRFSDILASIPGLLLGMVIVVVMGQSLRNLIIAVGVGAIPVFLRITRAAILNVRNQEFVEAAHAIGLPNTRILFGQVLPNGLAPIIVTYTIGLGMAIMIGASLSFLGFGVPVPAPEWGTLISGGREFIHVAPHLMTFPGIFIMITVLGFNLLGDGLRDALDPKLKRR